MINPMKLMKIKNAWSRFAANHPKFPLFLNAIVKKGIQEETIFEFKVTYPDGQQCILSVRISTHLSASFNKCGECISSTVH